MLNPWLTSLKMGADVALGVAAIYQRMMFLRSDDCPQPDDDQPDLAVYIHEDGDLVRFTDTNPETEDSESWIETDQMINLGGAI